MTEIKTIESQEQLDQLIASGERVVIDFHAAWCGPCKILSKTIDETPDLGVIYKSDVDVAIFPTVRNIPALLIFEGGEKIDQHVGILTSEELKKFITK